MFRRCVRHPGKYVGRCGNSGVRPPTHPGILSVGNGSS